MSFMSRTYTHNQVVFFANQNEYKPRIVQKDYFEKIFDKSQRKALTKNYKNISKGEKALIEAYGLMSDAGKYMKVASSTKDSKTKDKATKKAEKLDKEAQEIYAEAYAKIFKEINAVYSQYNTSYTKINEKTDTTLIAAAGRLYTQTRTAYSELEKKKEAAGKLALKDRNNEYKNIYEQQTVLLYKFEDVLGLRMGDKTIKYELPKVENNTTENNTVNPFVKRDSMTFKEIDANIITVNGKLYVSNEKAILAALSLTADEKSSVQNIYSQLSSARKLELEVDSLYNIIDQLRAAADTAKTTKNRESFKQKAETDEAKAFFKLVTAARMYIKVNEDKHNIYSKYITLITNNTPNDRATALANEANMLFRMASTKSKLAEKLEFISEKYVKLMEANEVELIGIEKDEEALSILLDLPHTERNILVEKKEVNNVTDIVIQNEKPDDKTTTNKNTGTGTTNTGNNVSLVKIKTLALTNDFIYRVQIGAFQKFDAATFANKYKISERKLKDGKNSVFFAGDFKTQEAIEIVLADVRVKGFKDAFYVVYIAGEVVTGSTAKAVIQSDAKLKAQYAEFASFETGELKKGRTYDQIYGSKKKEDTKKETDNTKKDDNEKVVDNKTIEKKDVTKVENKTTENKTTENKNTGFEQIPVSTTKGIQFFVQLGSFSNPINHSDVKNLTPIYIEKTDKVTRYMTGPYSSFAEAEKKMASVKALGLKNAYLVAYSDGKSMALYQARTLSEKKSDNSSGKIVENKTTTNNSVKIQYKVQVAAYKGDLPTNLKSNLDNLGKKQKVENFLMKDGVTIYTVGSFDTYEKAQEFKKQLSSYKIDNGFVVAFNGNEKITLDEAKRLLQSN